MSLNRKHKNQLEKCVGELPVEQWQELANVLKILLKKFKNGLVKIQESLKESGLTLSRTMVLRN